MNVIRCLRIIILLASAFTAAVVEAATADDQLLASLRFPRHKHLREDDWKDFVHLVPRLKRWDKENNTVEHDPVNMEEQTVKIADATSAHFTVSRCATHVEKKDLRRIRLVMPDSSWSIFIRVFCRSSGRSSEKDCRGTVSVPPRLGVGTHFLAAARMSPWKTG